MKNINEKKWTLEMISEFYAEGRVLFIGQINSGKKSFNFQVLIYHKEMIYSYNEINEEAQW